VILGFSNDIDRSKIPPDIQALLADSLAGRNIAAISTFLGARSPRAQLSQLGIPTLVLQGRRDFAFDADQALAAYRLLRGPKRLYLGDFGHTPATNPPAEYPYFATEVRQWFDRYLKGIQNGIDRRPPVEIAPDPWSGRTASFASLPPTRTLTFSWKGRSTLAAAGKVVRTTALLRHVETFGGATVTVPVSRTSGYPHLVVVLSALEPGKGEVVVAESAADTAAVRGKQRTVTVRLQDEITSIPARSRLRLTFGSTSTVQNPANLVYFNQAPSGSSARLGQVALRLPVLLKPVSP
jgi:hypothetical protein